jgi:23S rRNA pseudouridine1911/1915/1917 synthase
MNQHAKRRYQHEVFGTKARPKPAELDEDTVKEPTRTGPGLPSGVHAFTVEEPGRLDRFLAGSGDGLSRTRIKALVESGHVTVDGKVAEDAGAKVRAGQAIEITVPEPIAAAPAGEDIPLVVIFEDDHLIVINKPAGLVVHPAAGHETGTLVNALIAHCGDSLSGVGGVKRPGIVHRLDKDTSGLLVVAKTDAAHQGLSELFADHGRELSLTREYLAFVWGTPDRPAGAVDAPIGRHPYHREKQAIVANEKKGRFAITHFAVEHVFHHAGRPIASLVRCHLETGRTHQIRVHMAHIGCPVIGDPLYGQGFKTKIALLPEAAQAIVERLHRQALHAASLGFTHPATGEELMFESELPEELKALETALGAG